MLLNFSLYDFLPLGCAVIWACNGLVLRTQMDKLEPPAINAIRCGVAGIFFWLLVPFDAPLHGLTQVTLAQWGLFGVSLTLGIGLGDTLYLAAIKDLGVSRTMALAGVFPLAAVFFEVLIFDQDVDYRLFMGAILVTAGIIFISLSKRSSTKKEPVTITGSVEEEYVDSSRLGIGMILALSAALLWGLSTVLLKQAISHMTAIQANALRLPIVTVMLYMVWLRRLPKSGLAALKRTTWIIVLGSGVIGMGIGSLMFLSALQHSSAARVVTLTASSPLFGMILAALFLKEPINRYVVVGMFFCIAGVWCVL